MNKRHAAGWLVIVILWEKGRELEKNGMRRTSQASLDARYCQIRARRYLNRAQVGGAQVEGLNTYIVGVLPKQNKFKPAGFYSIVLKEPLRLAFAGTCLVF